MTLTDTHPTTVDGPARRGGAVCLVVAGLLGVVAGATQPDYGHSPAERLAGLDAGATPTVSVMALTLMQLFLVFGLVALGALLRPRSPRLAAWATVLGVVGAFGEAVSGGQSGLLLVMAHDRAHRSTYVGLLGDLNSSPTQLFSLLALLGSVVGLLLFSIAVLRTRTGARWVAPALWLFLVLEYVGSAVVPALGYVAVIAGLAGFVGLARELVARRAWTPSSTSVGRLRR